MITQTASIDLLAHTFGSIEAEAKPLTEVSFCYVLVSFHPYGPILKKLTRTTNYRVWELKDDHRTKYQLMSKKLFIIGTQKVEKLKRNQTFVVNDYVQHYGIQI